MPRAKKWPPSALALIERQRRPPELTRLAAEFQALLAAHRAARGLPPLLATVRVPGVAERIAGLFVAVRRADFEVFAFCDRGLARHPPADPAEAADHAEIRLVAQKIADGYTLPPGLPPLDRPY